MIKRLTVLAAAACFVFLQGCDTAVRPPSPSSDETKEYVIFDDANYVGSYSGKNVILEGMLSDIPWQHLINVPETHPEISYLNTVSGGQTVLYSKEPINCDQKVEIKGTVVEIQGKSKRPDSKEQHREYQLIVDTWRCID